MCRPTGTDLNIETRSFRPTGKNDTSYLLVCYLPVLLCLEYEMRDIEEELIHNFNNIILTKLSLFYLGPCDAIVNK